MKPKTAPVVLSLLFVTLVPAAHAHQIDYVGEYRIQIGWMNEPAVSNTPNGIELFVSPLDPSLPPEEQDFEDGIPLLYRDLKIQLVQNGTTVTLPLQPDHIPGKYFALVEPTNPGYYQVNVLGKINDTPVSLSLHAPKIENKEYIQFPPLPEDPNMAEHENFEDELAEIKNSIQRLESSKPGLGIEHVAVGIGIAAIATSAVAIRRR